MSGNVARWLELAIETVARARAPKEPPSPIGGETPPERAGLFERPSCPLCGATRGRVVVHAADGIAVVRCDVCSVRYTSPRYSREHRQLAYGPDYPYYLRARAGRAVDRALAQRPFLGRAGRLCELQPHAGRILDLGSGDGYFLDVMRDRGWETIGVDIEESVVRHAKETLGLDCRKIDVESDPLPVGPFDAVTMWGSLQLMYRPQRLLERIRGVLAPGGTLAIGLSNIKSLGAIVFRGHWQGLGLPRHVVHFTPETLRRLVEWSGYRSVKTAFETPRWISWRSIDDLNLGTGGRRRAVKAVASLIGGLSGRTVFGDTMEIYASADH